ncbi:MAG: ParB/RepB/Spo0J family partition protein [Thermodesulfobacteriaceae bacterium]|nr:ParB/RepB/Spo0J family partition protein [Thermodesulfobacteriaceae bacterium]MDW8136282.1 ParB/RepB/Spo0J family partition protein [Thermodesulfobacterium sp.]
MNTKKVLGRGLAELIPELEREVSLWEKPQEALEVNFLPLEKIQFSSFQVRKDLKEDESFQELILSIKERGVLQPILVRPLKEGNYECVAGERRLRACLKLGFKEIPAIVRNLSDEEVLLLGLIENIQRKNLNPLEEAWAYKTLIEKFGYTQEEVAKRVGKDRSTVTNLLRLLKLPSLLQEDLLEGRLTVGHAKVLLSLNTEEDQLVLRKVILEKQLSVRETEGYIKKYLTLKKKSSLKPSPTEAENKLKDLIREISALIDSKIKIKSFSKKTCCIFEFEDLTQVENFLGNLKSLFK